jgi:hypothetical protein
MPIFKWGGLPEIQAAQGHIMRQAVADMRTVTGVRETDLRPKPRLSRKFGIWGCYSTGTPGHPRSRVAGFGYCARDAYIDWRQRWDKANHG